MEQSRLRVRMQTFPMRECGNRAKPWEHGRLKSIVEQRTPRYGEMPGRRHQESFV